MSRKKWSRRRLAATIAAGVMVGGAAVAGGVVGITRIVRDPMFASAGMCQQQADADFAVHRRLVVPLLVGTVGPSETVDCDSGNNGGRTIVDTTAGIPHEVAVSALAGRGWQRLDATTMEWLRPGDVAYRTTISGDTVYVVAEDPFFGSQTPTGSITTVEIWTDH